MLAQDGKEVKSVIQALSQLGAWQSYITAVAVCAPTPQPAGLELGGPLLARGLGVATAGWALPTLPWRAALETRAQSRPRFYWHAVLRSRGRTRGAHLPSCPCYPACPNTPKPPFTRTTTATTLLLLGGARLCDERDRHVPSAAVQFCLGVIRPQTDCRRQPPNAPRPPTLADCGLPGLLRTQRAGYRWAGVVHPEVSQHMEARSGLRARHRNAP